MVDSGKTLLYYQCVLLLTIIRNYICMRLIVKSFFKRKFYFRLGILGAAFCLAGCAPPAPKWLKSTEFESLMGTVVKIDVCYDSSQKDQLKEAMKAVWARLEDINVRMNVFNEKSDVTKINQSYPHPIQIPADTYDVLEKSRRFTEMTSGAFDITMWPLYRLWKKGEETNNLPSQEEIHKAKEAVGMDKVKLLPGHEVQLTHPETKIDLGGIAAGYGVDEAVKIFHGHHFNNFLIDAGGDMYAGGQNCEGERWRLGIADPRARDRFIGVVGLSDAAITTSGDYSQFFEIQNTRWAHIINPSTGFPEKGVVSATLIAPTTVEADALATGLCVLGVLKGTEFVDSLGAGYASVMVDRLEDGKITEHPSRNYPLFLKQ